MNDKVIVYSQKRVLGVVFMVYITLHFCTKSPRYSRRLDPSGLYDPCQSVRSVSSVFLVSIPESFFVVTFLLAPKKGLAC